MKTITTVDVVVDCLVFGEGNTLHDSEEVRSLTLEVIDDSWLLFGTDGGADVYRISLEKLGLQRRPEESSIELTDKEERTPLRQLVATLSYGSLFGAGDETLQEILDEYLKKKESKDED